MILYRYIFRNLSGIIVNFFWLGLPLIGYWFTYSERSEETLLIWHVIVVLDIFTTFMTFITLIWIWTFCSPDPKSAIKSAENIFYEMKDYNNNQSKCKSVF